MKIRTCCAFALAAVLALSLLGCGQGDRARNASAAPSPQTLNDIADQLERVNTRLDQITAPDNRPAGIEPFRIEALLDEQYQPHWTKWLNLKELGLLAYTPTEVPTNRAARLVNGNQVDLVGYEVREPTYRAILLVGRNEATGIESLVGIIGSDPNCASPDCNGFHSSYGSGETGELHGSNSHPNAEEAYGNALRGWHAYIEWQNELGAYRKDRAGLDDQRLRQIKNVIAK